MTKKINYSSVCDMYIYIYIYKLWDYQDWIFIWLSLVKILSSDNLEFSILPRLFSILYCDSIKAFKSKNKCKCIYIKIIGLKMLKRCWNLSSTQFFFKFLVHIGDIFFTKFRSRNRVSYMQDLKLFVIICCGFPVYIIIFKRFYMIERRRFQTSRHFIQ